MFCSKSYPEKFPIFHAAVLWLSLLTSCLAVHAQVTFLQPPTFTGAGNVFIADFNNDGKLDVLVSDGTMNLGNGDGTFTNGTSLSGTPLAVGDFNGDGKLDVLEQGTGTLLVLLGNGDGTFQPAIRTSSGAALTLLAAVDLNGDGKADVVGYFNGAILVYISKGDGTFQAAVSYSISTAASVLTVGDFNGDQKPDIAVSASNQEIVLLGNGDGSLQTAKMSADIFSPSTVVTADFNGDKNLDLAISGESTTGTGTYILLGNGDGTFQAPVLAISAQGALAVGDVNGDGRQDLIVGSNDNSATMIYLGNGNGSFSNSANYYPNNGVLALADFNADGKLDLASGNQVLLGDGDGSFQGTGLALSTPTNNASVVVGDFEGNGKPDLAFVSSSTVYIFHNSGDALTQSYTYTLQSPGGGIVTADLNGDGKLDLVVFGTDSSNNWNYSVLLGNGDGSFQPPVYYPQSVTVAGNMVYVAIVADFNNDHQLDIAVVSANQTIAVLLGKGDGTFAAPVYYYDAGGDLTGVADFNKDGKLDILSSNGILYGNGDGTFQPVAFPTSLSHFAPAFVADLNNDGIPDLVSAGAQTALGNGDGTFLVLPPPLPPTSEAGYFVNAVADINGDGIPDAVAAYFTSISIEPMATNTGVLLGNGDGTFDALVDVPTNGTLPIYGLFTSPLVLIADMNGDRRPDILYNPQSEIAVLLNTTPAGQPDFKISVTQFSPSPVVSGTPSSSALVVTPLNGFNGDVTVSCPPQSSFSCTFSPTTISAGSGTATVTVTPNIPSGTFLFSIQGTSGSISRSAALPLVVDTSSTPDFQVSITSPSPSTVVPGGSVTAAVNVASIAGFAKPVSLACVVPGSSGSTCSLSPTSVTPSGSAGSTLTINTSTGAASGTQLVTVYGTSGSTIYGAGVALAISSDFSMGAASGSKTSQTVNAGGTANFALVLAAAPSFNGTVNLTCTVTPVATPPATCALSTSSLQLSGGSTQTITAAVGTTAAGTARTVPFLSCPPNGIPITCMLLTLASLCFWPRHRKRWILLSPAMLLMLALLGSCGGRSTTTHGSSGTPAGTYTVTVTATSGMINHPMTLQLIVH